MIKIIVPFWKLLSVDEYKKGTIAQAYSKAIQKAKYFGGTPIHNNMILFTINL